VQRIEKEKIEKLYINYILKIYKLYLNSLLFKNFKSDLLSIKYIKL